MVCPRSPLEYYGGIERHILEISKRLVKQGVNIRIFTSSTKCRRPSEKTIEGIEVRTFPALAPSEIYYFSMPLLQALRREDSKIIHCHGYQSFPTLAAVVTKRSAQKLVITLHSAWPSSLITRLLHVPYKVILNNMFKKANKIICVSNFEHERFRHYLNISKDKFSVIENGVDPKEFNVKRDSLDIVPSNARIILSIARLEKYKGQHHLIKGFARLDLSRDPDLKLVLVGSGPYKRKLVKIVNQLQIEKDVIFLEKLDREEILALYQKCELFVHLSRYEAYSVSIIEAIANRKPVIVSMVPSLTDFVRKGLATGILYPPRPEEVAQKMREILNAPKKFAPKKSRIYTWDEVTERVRQIYSELLACG